MEKKKGKEKSDQKVLEVFSGNLKPLVKGDGDFHRRIGVSKSTASEYINGISLPRADILYKISLDINKSIDWLLTGEDHRTQTETPVQESSTNLQTLIEIIREQNKRIEEQGDRIDRQENLILSQKDLIAAQGERITEQGKRIDLLTDMVAGARAERNKIENDVQTIQRVLNEQHIELIRQSNKMKKAAETQDISALGDQDGLVNQ